MLTRIAHGKGNYTQKARDSPNHRTRALCRPGLGLSYEVNGQSKLAFKSYTQALKMFKQAQNDDFDDITDLAHGYKGHCLIGLGNLSIIEQKCQQAISYYRNAFQLFYK
ncbi:unnamed protein product [Rotaria magnacalcarata]|uniref:Uncharacterized protein n=1 Tax=Rotaria magnacalcarata TaxID=392030 RepID=A0A815JP24_9BILA|nr:unnamed protein product [Rotaria magnacalcarata]CAF5180115.1 unnamed protein product [Rotaria magnacalcarata]